MHVLHVGLQALWALAGVANGPDRAVDFAQDVFDHGFIHALDLLHLVVLDQLLVEAQLLRQLVHDHVVGTAFPQRLDDLLAPLQRAVGRRAGTAGFKLRGCRQQVHRAVGVQVFGLAGHGGHGSGGRWVGIYHHQQVQLVHGALHFEATGLRVGGMAPIEHAAQVAVLVDQLVLLQHAVNPARHGDAVLGHHRGRGVLLFDPLEVHTPHVGEVLPRTFGQAVVAGQRVGVGAHIRRALHVVVTAEDVGAATALAHVAQGQLQDAGGTHHGVADGVLRLAHAPHDGARAAVGQHLGDLEHLFFLDAAGLFHLVGCPLGHDLVAHLFHAVDTVVDVLLVFPAVLEDVIDQAEQEGDVGARADAHVLVGLGGRAGETWVHHDHLAAGFLGVQHVQHAHRVSFGRVGADVQGDLAVLHVVVRIGHGAVAPGVRHTRHGGGVANARLVVAVVAAPEAHELAQQVGLFVVVLGRADEVHAVRAAGLAQLQHLGGDFGQGRIPADALVLAIHQLHGVAQAVFAVAVLAQGCTLGAVGAQVDGRIEHGLLAHPHAVFHHGIHGAAHRAVGADRAAHFDLAVAQAHLGAFSRLRLLDQGELRGRNANAYAQARAAQECAAVHGGQRLGQAPAQAVNKGRGCRCTVRCMRRLFGEQHGAPRNQSWVVL